MLVKKVEAFSRAMEVECKRVKREAVTKEKEDGSAKMDDTKKIKKSIPLEGWFHPSNFPPRYSIILTS